MQRTATTSSPFPASTAFPRVKPGNADGRGDVGSPANCDFRPQEDCTAASRESQHLLVPLIQHVLDPQRCRDIAPRAARDRHSGGCVDEREGAQCNALAVRCVRVAEVEVDTPTRVRDAEPGTCGAACPLQGAGNPG